MYAWIWQHLPGNRRVRAAIALLLFAIVVLACMRWVFPLIGAALATNGATVATDRPVLLVNWGQIALPGPVSSVGVM